MSFARIVSLQEKSAGAGEMMKMGYEDDMNTDQINYSQKYEFLVDRISELIDRKTVKTTNTIFYDLITVSELQKILDDSKENESWAL